MRGKNAATISNDELVEKLRHYATEGYDPGMAFILGVASGRIIWQEELISELKASLESADLKMEDNA